MKLNFIVVAEENSEPLAAFQYEEWAKEWRDKMCATGLVKADKENNLDSHCLGGNSDAVGIRDTGPKPESADVISNNLVARSNRAESTSSPPQVKLTVTCEDEMLSLSIDGKHALTVYCDGPFQAVDMFARFNVAIADEKRNQAYIKRLHRKQTK